MGPSSLPSDEKASFIQGRIRRFRFAFAGLKTLFESQINVRIHLIAAIIAALLGLLFHITASEWCVVVILIGVVFMAEIFNTALETLCDHVQPTYHDKIKAVKDLGAAGVLTVSACALLVGGIIFIPKLIHFILRFLD